MTSARKEPGLLGGLFGSGAKKTVDGVMSAFNQALNDLKDVQREQEADALVKREQAAQLQREAADAEREAQRAVSVQAHLQQLLGA